MIDIARVPDRALLDTSVLVSALDKPNEDYSLHCRELFNGLLAAKNRVSLVASHSIAELLHGPAKTSLPRSRHLHVVSFDDLAADLLGKEFPADVLKRWDKEHGAPRTYYKYDALILASAKRHRASCVLTLDSGMADLGKLVGIKVYHPRDFERSRESGPPLPILEHIERASKLN